MIWSAGLWLPIVAAGQEVGEVTPVEGEPFDARLTGIDADWTFHFRTDTAMPSLPAIDLVSWGAQVDRDEGPIVVLADGGRLIGRVSALAGDRLLLRSDVWGDVSLPLERVRGVVFAPPAAAAERDKLEQTIAAAGGEQDMVLLRNGDRVSGFLRAPPSVAGPSPTGRRPLEALTLEVQGAEVEIPLDNVTALVFNPALITPPRFSGMHVDLGMDDGSLLRAAAVRPGQLVTVTLPGGVRLTTDAETMWEETVFARPATPRVVYLSELRPIGYKHIPFLDLAWPYHADRNVLGGKLRAAGRVYSKGLGMHSASRLAYHLGGEFERFEAGLAIDTAAGRSGSATVRVFLDRGEGAWEAAYTSPVLRGGQQPLPVSLDVRGAERMAILVEFADRGDVCDYVDLLAARLVR